MQANPNRYSSVNYILSIPGILKIFSIIFFLASSIIFLSSPICPRTSPWYSKLYPISAATSGVLVSLMYALFAIGVVRRGFPVWNMIDLVFSTFDFMLMLTVSILTFAACDRSTISTAQLIPGPMGMIGALLLATSSAVWFLKFRTAKELVLTQERNIKPLNVNQYRKSVIV